MTSHGLTPSELGPDTVVRGADRQRERNWLPFLRGVVSGVVAVAFGCATFASRAGHGLLPLVMFAWPEVSAADAAPSEMLSICVIWGSTCVLLLSHLMSSRAIGAVMRLIALASLYAVWLFVGIQVGTFQDRKSLLFTCITSVPFVMAAFVEAVLDVAALRARRTWTFTVRDIALLTVVVAGYALPFVRGI